MWMKCVCSLTGHASYTKYGGQTRIGHSQHCGIPLQWVVADVYILSCPSVQAFNTPHNSCRVMQCCGELVQTLLYERRLPRRIVCTAVFFCLFSLYIFFCPCAHLQLNSGCVV